MAAHLENALWYRKWNTVFFTVCLLSFSVPCIYLELTKSMTVEGRVILGGMLLLIQYGWIRSILLLRKALGIKRKTFHIFPYKFLSTEGK